MLMILTMASSFILMEGPFFILILKEVQVSLRGRSILDMDLMVYRKLFWRVKRDTHVLLLNGSFIYLNFFICLIFAHAGRFHRLSYLC